MRKETILAIFDKANGYGALYGDKADYSKIKPVRDRFIKILDEEYELDGKTFLRRVPRDTISNVKKEYEDDIGEEFMI